MGASNNRKYETRRESVQNTDILQNSSEQMKCKAFHNSLITILIPININLLTLIFDKPTSDSEFNQSLTPLRDGAGLSGGWGAIDGGASSGQRNNSVEPREWWRRGGEHGTWVYAVDVGPSRWLRGVCLGQVAVEPVGSDQGSGWPCDGCLDSGQHVLLPPI